MSAKSELNNLINDFESGEIAAGSPLNTFGYHLKPQVYSIYSDSKSNYSSSFYSDNKGRTLVVFAVDDRLHTAIAWESRGAPKEKVFFFDAERFGIHCKLSSQGGAGAAIIFPTREEIEDELAHD